MLPPPQPDALRSLPGQYANEWVHSVGGRRRIAEPHIGGGPGNPYANWVQGPFR
jgi:hypothetical protein